MAALTRPRPRTIADVAIIVGVAGFSLLLVAGPPTEGPWPHLLGLIIALGHGVALWWRRRHPELVLLIALAGGLVMHLLAPDGVFPLAALFALGSLAAARPLSRSLPALAAVLGLSALNYLSIASPDATFAMPFPIAAWALGEVVRNRRVAIEQAERRAVGEEQARLSRELHDVIAHSVSVIVVQAAAADDVFDSHPEQARQALRAIETAGRDALGELRRLLTAFGPEPGRLARTPQPGLAELAALAEPLRAAGLAVTISQDCASDLPPGLELSAYRIVQEALTNTLRHAGARTARVSVRQRSGVLEVDVHDDGNGTGTALAGAGRGISGMRERAALHGGTVEAGVGPDGGFRVHARLPLAGAR